LRPERFHIKKYVSTAWNGLAILWASFLGRTAGAGTRQSRKLDRRRPVNTGAHGRSNAKIQDALDESRISHHGRPRSLLGALYNGACFEAGI